MPLDDNGSPRAVSGKEIYFSHSAAETFQGCQTRWFLTKVMGLKEPGDEASDRGTAIHYVGENYLESGKLVAPGTYNDGKEDITVTSDDIARFRRSIQQLPPPGMAETEAWAEKLVVHSSDRGTMRFTGAIDFHLVAETPEQAAWLPRRFRDFRGLIVGDHKTKSRLDGQFGAKTEEALALDSQGLKYAYVLAKRYGLEGRPVLFLHNYISRGAPEVALTVAIMQWEDIEVEWRRAGRLASEQLAVLAENETERDVPKDMEYCYSFGKRCPFQGKQCSASKARGLITLRSSRSRRAEQLENPTQEDTMSGMTLMERMRAAKAKRHTGGSEETKATAPVEETKATAPVEETKAAAPVEGEKTTAPVEEEKVDVPAPGQLQSRDTSPVDDDTVTPEFLRDVVEVVMETAANMGSEGETLRKSDVLRIMADEGLSRAWIDNVLFLATVDGAPDLSKFGDAVEQVPAGLLSSLASGTVDEQAKALASLSMSVFSEMAAKSPRGVLLRAQAYGDAVQAATIRQILAEGGLLSPAPKDTAYKAVVDEVWMAREGGLEVTDALIDQLLKAEGFAKSKSPKKIREVREALDALDTFREEEAGVSSVVDSDAPVAPAREEPAEIVTPKVEVVTDSETLRSELEAALTGCRGEKDLLSVVSSLVAPEAAKKVKGILDLIVRSAEARGAASATPDTPVEREPATAAQTPVLYVGCAPTDGSVPDISECPELVSAIQSVEAWMEGKGQRDHSCRWYLWNEFGDTGHKRLHSALLDAFVDAGGAKGSYVIPRGSIFEAVDIPTVWTISGGLVVTRMG